MPACLPGVVVNGWCEWCGWWFHRSSRIVRFPSCRFASSCPPPFEIPVSGCWMLVICCACHASRHVHITWADLLPVPARFVFLDCLLAFAFSVPQLQAELVYLPAFHFVIPPYFSLVRSFISPGNLIPARDLGSIPPSARGIVNAGARQSSPRGIFLTYPPSSPPPRPRLTRIYFSSSKLSVY